MAHEKFHYRSLEEIKQKAKELELHIPFAEDTQALAKPIHIRNTTLTNRLGIAPMEGADSLPDGSPSEYTKRPKKYVDRERRTKLCLEKDISLNVMD